MMWMIVGSRVAFRITQVQMGEKLGDCHFIGKKTVVMRIVRDGRGKIGAERGSVLLGRRRSKKGANAREGRAKKASLCVAKAGGIEHVCRGGWEIIQRRKV